MFSHPPSSFALRRRPRSNHGFTLVEMMVTVAVLAVLMAIAAPSFTPLLERWRVRQAVEGLQSSLYLARSEAIKRSGGVTLEANTSWAEGWVIKHSGTVTLQQGTNPGQVTITATGVTNTVHVDRWGMLSDSGSGAAKAMDFLVAPSSGNTSASSRLCVSISGRITQVKDGGNCP